MKKILTAGWLVITYVAVAYSQFPVRLPAATVEKLERTITSEMARQNIPGMSAAIVTDHQVRWSNGFGFSDLENFVPAKASTVYRLGSISKPITAVAAMQLVEQGKLDLDAPVQRYIPSFPQKPWPLTARHLISHIGGVRHYRGDEINLAKQYHSLTEGLSIFKDDSLLFQPGTRYSYSTYGYNLLGVAVEGASGTSFVEYTREQIFKPAGMDRARDDNVYDVIYNRAYGYRKTESGEKEVYHSGGQQRVSTLLYMLPEKKLPSY